MTTDKKLLVIGIVFVAIFTTMLVANPYNSENESQEQTTLNTDTSNQVIFEAKSLTVDDLDTLEKWSNDYEKFYPKERPTLEEIDRRIWYMVIPIDTERGFEEFCENVEKVYDAEEEAVESIGINSITKNYLFNDMYVGYCLYNEIEMWNLGKELEYVAHGNEPLDEDLLKMAINKELTKQDVESKSHSTISSDYCQALRKWINEYQGSEWLTHEAKIEYDKVCS